MNNEKRVFIFWVYDKKKYLSFHQLPGYEAVIMKDFDSMWERVHQYIEKGYMVG